MNQPFDAIYENGVLKPLQPLQLPEHTQVKVTVEAEAGGEDSQRTQSQHDELQSLLNRLQKSPQQQSDDAWSAANHDDLLYGQGS